MSVEATVFERAGSSCELCQSPEDLRLYLVPPEEEQTVEKSVLVCPTCESQIKQTSPVDANHWRCLNASMWSEVSAVQVVAWRMLNRLSEESWARDLLEMLFLDDALLEWAKAGATDGSESKPTRDSNGTELQGGDTITLIKDLDVKGGGFTAKRGTTVKNISLTDDPEQIEGRVNGVRIVLLTKYLKKIA
jgi:protein PhnA